MKFSYLKNERLVFEKRTLNVIFDVLKLSSNFESLLSFKYSDENNTGSKIIQITLIELWSFIFFELRRFWRCPKMQNLIFSFFQLKVKRKKNPSSTRISTLRIWHERDIKVRQSHNVFPRQRFFKNKQTKKQTN